MRPNSRLFAMKILLISFEFGEHVLGGLGRVVNGLTQELRKHVVVDVFLLYFSPSRLAISAKVLRCDGQRWGEEVLSFTRGYAARSVELCRQEKYDVVHFLSVHWIIGEVINRITRELPEQKIVYSVHSLIKYEQGIRLNPRSFLACERKLLESAAWLHVLNETSKSYLGQAYPELGTAKPCSLIPNGVRMSDFESRDEKFRSDLEKRLSANVFTVVCLSRWAHGKGLEHLALATARLLEAGYDIQLVLAGRKYISWEKRFYAYVAKVQHLAARLGSRCVVLGWLDAKQRNTLFERADVCVVPSELEYYPYSVLEPAAAEVPLICSDLPCVRELLVGGRECSLFRTGDAQDLAGKLAESFRAPERGKQMARRAREKVARVCDWTRIATSYVEMYRDTLALPASHRRLGAA
jgi:glycosyltransferase involved in cell wall biosynthesis